MKIRIDTDTADLIQRHATATGLTVDTIVDKLLGSHLAELYELEAFHNANAHDIVMQAEAANLLISYGGRESILAGITRLAPDHETLEVRFLRAVDSPYVGLAPTAA